LYADAHTKGLNLQPLPAHKVGELMTKKMDLMEVYGQKERFEMCFIYRVWNNAIQLLAQLNENVYVYVW
jgi:hypothetical protein